MVCARTRSRPAGSVRISAIWFNTAGEARGSGLPDALAKPSPPIMAQTRLSSELGDGVSCADAYPTDALVLTSGGTLDVVVRTRFAPSMVLKKKRAIEGKVLPKLGTSTLFFEADTDRVD